jgi:hypothetical protein
MHPNRLIGPIITTLSLASVPTVAQPLEPLPGIVEDAQRLDQPTAEARFDALTALLDDYGLTYEVQTFSNPRATEAGPTEGHNLIVDIGEGERDLVVGAHYDAAPLEDGSLSHGMVDNASSVAVLARLAATLSNESLDHRLRILFFDLEEIQLLGSAHYVSTPDAQRVAAMVNLDINGYGNTVIYGPASNDGNTEVYDALERVCAAGGHGCRTATTAASRPPASRTSRSACSPRTRLASCTACSMARRLAALPRRSSASSTPRMTPPTI